MGDFIAVTEIEEMVVGDRLLVYDMNQISIHTITSLDDGIVMVDDIYDIEPNHYGQWIIITKDDED